MMIAIAGSPECMRKPVTAIVALLIGPVALLSACSNDSNKESSKTETTPPPAAAPLSASLTTQLKNADGTGVANATIEFMNGYATITVVTDACAGSTPENHRAAMDVMALYPPQITLATTEDVLG